MTADILTPAVMEWAERTRPGARVAGCAVRPLAGGAVARRVEQVTLHMTGHHDPLELVRKQAPAHEIAGLRAAQAVRPETTAIPELVAWGSDWLITPLAPGSPLAWAMRSRRTWSTRSPRCMPATRAPPVITFLYFRPGTSFGAQAAGAHAYVH